MLAGEGMSTRAIAPIVGVDHVTVSRDIAATGVAFATPEPSPAVESPLTDEPGTVTKLTGANSAAEVIADQQTGEVIDGPVITAPTRFRLCPDQTS
jgi:hypothetical protein